MQLQEHPYSSSSYPVLSSSSSPDKLPKLRFRSRPPAFLEDGDDSTKPTGLYLSRDDALLRPSVDFLWYARFSRGLIRSPESLDPNHSSPQVPLLSVLEVSFALLERPSSSPPAPVAPPCNSLTREQQLGQCSAPASLSTSLPPYKAPPQRLHATHSWWYRYTPLPVSYTHLRAHETPEHLVCRLLLEKKKNNKIKL
eukprot:TRINITY_DN17595_c0_g1_i1.p1 TRINITY_DN17595_c0_g1~~TRINITY_DN17595_c0_g1_i1.p1  ORF type:complete len:197 (-),score=20.42 TRINITY_DN17595_c0_g1_i1:115-705(-)